MQTTSEQVKKRVDWSLFREWVASLPPQRLFNYWDCKNCAIIAFVRETTGLEIGFGWHYGDYPDSILRAVLDCGDKFTAKKLKSILLNKRRKSE